MQTVIYGRQFTVRVDEDVVVKAHGNTYGEYRLEGVRGARYMSIRRTDGSLFFVSERKLGNIAFEGDSFTDEKVLMGWTKEEFLAKHAG